MRQSPGQAEGGPHRHALVTKARASIENGSKSFAVASKLFDKRTREKVWLLYAWCRRCDDIADAQDAGRPAADSNGDLSDARDRLRTIRVLTDLAFDGTPTADPAFDAFGLVARETGITRAMADDVIAGFALDARDWRPRDEAGLIRYCYHVAGAVGVMMAVVMGADPADDETLDRACDLGLAFQLANIARDIAEDDAADRCYIPVSWLVEEDIEPGQHMKPHHRGELADMAERMIVLMDRHAQAAKLGTTTLPFRSRWAVLSAAGIYTEIGHEVRRRGRAAWDHRIYTTRAAKLRHVAAAFAEARRNAPPPPTEMPYWTRTKIFDQLAERGAAS